MIAIMAKNSNLKKNAPKHVICILNNKPLYREMCLEVFFLLLASYLLLSVISAFGWLWELTCS